ncbi:MAG: DUF1883 domain-containing protein [Defluviitaleaceae bacterium]|nr:DUF1883 domain-containing protein [Defluviitaleaceae bacterium]
MSFTHYELGGLPKGKVVEVVLQGNTANVYLMDQDNFGRYNKGMSFIALGGLMTFSPIRLQTTENGHWHVVIDLPQGKGQVKTSCQVTATKMANISTKPATFKPSPTMVAAAAAAKKAAAEKSAAAAPAPAAPAGMVTCASCKALTIRGKFCAECGQPMALSCPGCSITLAPSCKFCPECGFKIA